MHGQTVDALVRRLERLEGEARRWKGAVGVILAGLAALVLMGQAAPPTMSRVVEAEKFVLRDTRGKARAWLESSNGAVNLALADKEERSRVFLYVEADGAVGLALFDRGGIRRAGLNLVADGTPRVSLADKTGSPRLQANVGSNDVPDLSLIDTEGRRIAMFVLPDGKPAFGLIDAAARVRAAMDLGKDGAVRLMLADPRATERAELIVMPDGTPRLTLVGRTGRITYHGP